MLLRELVEPARKLLPASPYLNPSSNGHPSTPPPNPKKSRHLCATIIQAESRHLCATIIQSFSRFAASSLRESRHLRATIIQAVSRFIPCQSHTALPFSSTPPSPSLPLLPFLPVTSGVPPSARHHHSGRLSLHCILVSRQANFHSPSLSSLPVPQESLQLHATIIKAVSRFVASSVQVKFTFLPQTLETSQNSSAVSRFVASSSRIKPSQLPLLVSAFFISPIPASSLHVAGAVEGARRWSAVLQGVQQMLSAGLNAFECSRGLLPPPKKLSYSIVSSHSSFTSHPALSLPQQIRPTLTLQFHPTPGPISTQAAIQASSRSHSEAAAAEAAAGAGAGAGVSAAGEGMASVAGEGRAEEAEEGRAAAGEEARGATMEGKGPGEKESSKGSAPVYMSTREACALLSSLSSSLSETDVALLAASTAVINAKSAFIPVRSAIIATGSAIIATGSAIIATGTAIGTAGRECKQAARTSDRAAS
ncbi:unnamed protein product [Closterium sp. NIES-64]|nr:unnamed protein product [Closterium sp. NIES-64]